MRKVLGAVVVVIGLLAGVLSAPAAAAPVDAQSSWSSGTVQPLATQNWVWNNANATLAYAVGLSPVGATSSSECSFEVVHSTYAKRPSGELEFRYTVKNVGTASCKATIRIAFLASSISWTSPSVPPNSGVITSKGNSTPLNRIYVPGLEPVGAGCQYDITRTIYSQWLNRGVLQRRYDLWLDNTGAVTCAPKVHLAFLTG